MARFTREENELAVKVEVEKQKDGAEDDTYDLTFIIQELEEFDPDTKQRASSLVLDGQRKPRPPALAENYRICLDLLRELQPATYTQWAKVAADHTISLATFKRALADLNTHHLVCQDVDRRYSVVPEPS